MLLPTFLDERIFSKIDATFLIFLYFISGLMFDNLFSFKICLKLFDGKSFVGEIILINCSVEFFIKNFNTLFLILFENMF